jgi:hypothetical protein
MRGRLALADVVATVYDAVRMRRPRSPRPRGSGFPPRSGPRSQRAPPLEQFDEDEVVRGVEVVLAGLVANPWVAGSRGRAPRGHPYFSPTTAGSSFRSFRVECP